MEVLSKPTLAEIKVRVSTLRKPANDNPPGHIFDDVHELVAIIDGLQNDVKNKDKHIQDLGRQAKTQIKKNETQIKKNEKLTSLVEEFTSLVKAMLAGFDAQDRLREMGQETEPVTEPVTEPEE